MHTLCEDPTRSAKCAKGAGHRRGRPDCAYLAVVTPEAVVDLPLAALNTKAPSFSAPDLIGSDHERSRPSSQDDCLEMISADAISPTLARRLQDTLSIPFPLLSGDQLIAAGILPSRCLVRLGSAAQAP
jgi:hypothetical protein